jgi:NADPH2:quinone reductase
VRAVQITAFGGPEVLQVAELPDPVPQGDEVLIEVETAGVNYADTHQADNSYLAPQHLPLVPGIEVVGRIRGGPDDGRRVLALLPGSGGYAELALTPPSLVHPIGEDLSDAAARALLVQGTTAWHLLRTCTHLQPGETVVVHSAAGGVGSIAVQLAKAWGAGRVIATCTGQQKRTLVESLGADASVDLSDATDARSVKHLLREANDGRPVDVVLEMSGGHVFDGSLAALRPLGRLAVFGMASRTPPSPVDVTRLMAGSTSVTGFWLTHALSLPGGLTHALEELTSMVRAGRLTPVTGGSYPLAEAPRAHEDLRSRATTGKLVLEVARVPAR